MSRQMLGYLRSRPLMIFNMLAVALLAALFAYQMLRPIDVLENWKIDLSPSAERQEVDGEYLQVYYPNESLIFTSSSIKLINASGSVTRAMICDATDDLGEREITLDMIPASRRPGEKSNKASSIIVPDVTQFNRLPRTCRLVFDIVYKVEPFRVHTEYAESPKFIVKERNLSATEVREQIQSMRGLIEDLEARLNK